MVNNYVVRFISTHKIAARFTSRGAALYWLQCNNFDADTGDCLGLFEVVKAPAYAGNKGE